MAREAEAHVRSPWKSQRAEATLKVNYLTGRCLTFLSRADIPVLSRASNVGASACSRDQALVEDGDFDATIDGATSGCVIGCDGGGFAHADRRDAAGVDAGGGEVGADRCRAAG